MAHDMVRDNDHAISLIADTCKNETTEQASVSEVDTMEKIMVDSVQVTNTRINDYRLLVDHYRHAIETAVRRECEKEFGHLMNACLQNFRHVTEREKNFLICYIAAKYSMAKNSAPNYPESSKETIEESPLNIGVPLEGGREYFEEDLRHINNTNEIEETEDVREVTKTKIVELQINEKQAKKRLNPNDAVQKIL